MENSTGSSGREFAEVANQGDGRNAGLLLIGELANLDVVAAFPEKHLADGLHDLGDLDALGAADVAGVAGSAHPDGAGLEEFLLQPELGEPDDLIWQDVHLRNRRTARRALAALIAGEERLAADLFNLFHEIASDFPARKLRSHIFPFLREANDIRFKRVGFLPKMTL
jgi:hypothetical protein